MRRISAILLLLLLLPGLATAQRMVPASQAAEQQGSQMTTSQDAWLVPVWRSPDGHLLALLDHSQRIQAPLRLISDENLEPTNDVLSLGGSQMSSAGVSVRAGSRLYSTMRVSGSSPKFEGDCDNMGSLAPDCLGSRETWRGGTLKGGYQADGMQFDVGLNWLQHDPASEGLVLLVPDTDRSTLMGIPSQWIESLNLIEANGSVELGDSGTHFNMGASLGRVRLLPDNVRVLRPGAVRLNSSFEPGLDRIDQKAITLGLGKGAISGALVGRLMQPEASGQVQAGAMRQWSAVDLGITVRLPWEGELSLGAQNLWSSGESTSLPSTDRNPVQSRIPYIQYHQEL